MDRSDLRIELDQRLADRAVQRVHRAVAFVRGDEQLLADANLHHRLGDHLAPVVQALADTAGSEMMAALDHHEVFQLERRAVAGARAADQQLE